MNANAIVPQDEQSLRRIVKRGVADIIVEDEFVERLRAGKPLRLKMGFDPSATDIHMGHAVGLRKLRQLQDIGHKVVLIVGDWTAQIGDPSGKSATRPMLTAEQVRANAETYMAQFFQDSRPRAHGDALADRVVRRVRLGGCAAADQPVHGGAVSGRATTSPSGSRTASPSP